MKNYIVFFILITFTILGACKKKEEQPILPRISFKSSVNYTAGDKDVAPGTSILTGIVAEKSDVDNVGLKKFELHVVYDNNSLTDSVLFTNNISGADTNEYSTDYSFITRNKTGIETYNYMVTNKEGRSNTLSLRLNVHP